MKRAEKNNLMIFAIILVLTTLMGMCKASADDGCGVDKHGLKFKRIKDINNQIKKTYEWEIEYDSEIQDRPKLKSEDPNEVMIVFTKG